MLGGLEAERHAHAVVEQVAVREEHALGRAGGAGGVLDIRDVAGRGGVFGIVAAAGQHFLPRTGAQPYHVFERQRVAIARFGEDVAVVGVGVPFVEEERADPGFAEHVAQFVGAVGGVDVHQHDAGAGRGVLQQHPLQAVAGPDAGAVARTQTEARQATGRARDLGVQFTPCQPRGLVTDDESFAIPEFRRGILQSLRNGLFEQGHVGPASITQMDHKPTV